VRNDRIRARLASGKTPEQVAVEFGLKRVTIYGIAKSTS
jgi:hypothetical protein